MPRLLAFTSSSWRTKSNLIYLRNLLSLTLAFFLLVSVTNAGSNKKAYLDASLDNNGQFLTSSLAKKLNRRLVFGRRVLSLFILSIINKANLN